MSIATDLTAIATSLSGILGDINTALDAKGVSTGAETLDEVPDKIGDISQSGGTPTLTFKSTNYVTVQRTSATEISFSGLNVSASETLVGVCLTAQGTLSSTSTDVNNMYVFQNGSDCIELQGYLQNGNSIVAAYSNGSFTKSGETGGTVTLPSLMSFLEGDYRVYPIVATVS